MAFGYWADNAIGNDGNDELAFFDTKLDMSILGISMALALVVYQQAQWVLLT